MFIDWWKNKEDVVRISNRILFTRKKEQDITCSNMDATWDYHTKWSINVRLHQPNNKSERERQIPYDIL